MKTEQQKSNFIKHNVRRCDTCQTPDPDKGRAFDGRRAYRCKCCGRTWTEGMQGKQKEYSEQREGYQFADSKGTGHIA